MEFKISLENRMVRDAIRDWVVKECPRDRIEEWDAADQYPERLTKELAKLRFCAMTISEDFGGEGIDIQGACIVAEEIGARFYPLALWFTHQAFLSGFIIQALGSEGQKRDLLLACAGGEFLMTPVGLDNSNFARAVAHSHDQDGITLNGDWEYVMLADQADRLLVPTAMEKEDKAPASVFMVDTNLAGVSVEIREKIGCKGARYARVRLDNVRVGTADILGGVDALKKGPEHWQYLVDISRLMTSAAAFGLARGAFDYTLDYARQRVQFGQAIGKFAALRTRFSQMSCDIDTSRLLVARAAWCADNDIPFHREALTARLKAGETALTCAMEGLQIYGGYGYTMEYDIQRYVRDAAGLSSAADGDQCARENMGKLLGL